MICAPHYHYALRTTHYSLRILGCFGAIFIGNNVRKNKKHLSFVRDERCFFPRYHSDSPAGRCPLVDRRKNKKPFVKRRKALPACYHSHFHPLGMDTLQILLLHIPLSSNGQAPSLPTWFSELLGDEFISFDPSLFTDQWLSAVSREITISRLCICYVMLKVW